MKKEVVLGVCASVAIYKSCEILRQLKKKGIGVTVVMTERAREFIRPVLFESLSANPVYCKMFESPKSWEIEHVSLADKADLVLIAPATADTIAKISAGICDDLLTCVCCATKAKVLICPAMDENMYTNRITQENIRRLKSLGFAFVEPKHGELASGKKGAGCLADVDEIVAQALKVLRVK